MILVDSSVWITHLQRTDNTLLGLLGADRVLAHPHVIGEVALGGPRQTWLLADMQDLPQARVATDAEVLGFILRHQLAGMGVGHVDAHLLAAARLTRDCRLWTRDKRLARAADRLGLLFQPGA